MRTVPDSTDQLPPIGHTAWRDNWTIGRQGLRMEIMETATRKVWLCQDPVTADRYRALELPVGYRRSGIGVPVADVAYFRRSPDAPVDGPVEVMQVDGLRFAYVARPGAAEAGHDHALVLPVHKAHTMFYAAGRTIEVLDVGDGWDHVAQTGTGSTVGTGRSAGARRLPATWSIREIPLERDLVVEVPDPARVFFFADGSSFQGPVRLSF